MHGDSFGATAPDDEWDDENEGPRGHPIIAILIGVAVILASLLAPDAHHANLSLAYALGRTAGGAVLIWTIAYFATIRHSGVGWQVGSFMIFTLASAFASFVVLGADIQAIRKDLSSFADLQFRDNGEATLSPEAAARGPLARLMAEHIDGVNADGRRLEARIAALGIDKLADPVALKRNPKILSDCGSIDQGKDAVAQGLASGKARIAEFKSKIDALALPEQVRIGMHKGILEAEQTGTLERQFGLLNEMLDEQRAICTVLARRHWQPSNGMFLFSNRADLSAFDAHGSRLMALAAEARQLRAQQLEKVRKAQEAMQQMLR